MTTDKGIFIKNVYYMLAYAFQALKQEDFKKVAGEPFEKIHDLFAAILEKGVSRQVKQGLYREYVPMQEELSVMRGKLNINETIRLKVQRKQKLACEFDDFSEDNLYNQILKTTMERLISVGDVEPDRKLRLRKLLVYFNNVNVISPDTIPWNRLIYQRNNLYYELLLNLCYLVLNDFLQTTDEGVYKLISFTDEHMERLYERFIQGYYKQHFPQLSPASTYIEWDLTKQPDLQMIQFLPKMKTDIVLTQNGKTLIIDAKYYGKTMAQNYSKETLRSAHLYQIFSYVKNMDKANSGDVSGLLLYAKTGEELFPEGKPFVIGGNSIGAKTLGLDQEFDLIANQLDRIVGEYFVS